MKSVFATLAAVTLAASNALAQFTINTPTNPVVCQPLLISWTGGQAPYFLSILPGNQPNAAALVDFGQVDGNSKTWIVNQPIGTSLGLNLRDSSGVTAQSAPFTVNAGTDTSCIGKDPASSSEPSTVGNTSAAGTGTSAVSTPATSSVSVPPSVPTSKPATTTAPVTSGTSKPATSVSGTSSVAKPTSSSAAAPTQAAGLGAAAFIGAAAIALLA